MPTDNDRREVARRLRETGEELGSAALLWYHIAKALGVRTATDGKTACDMLADLIEPSCDREKLLRLADSVQYAGENVSAKHRYTVGVTLRNIADRIREALGVQDA